jgi:2-keto-4-pentenoate hydratase
MAGDVDRDAELRWLADELWAARRQRRLLDLDQLIEDRGSDWSIAEAYRVQAMVVHYRFDRGERQIGWKLGYTSLAMRQQMGTGDPTSAL